MNVERWQSAAVVCGVVFCAFSAAHLIDEFLWRTPMEFHLLEPTTELLALGYMLVVVGLLALAARGRRGGFLGLAIAGGIIVAADVVKHGPEVLARGPWRSLAVSEALALGLTLNSLLMLVASILSLRRGGGS